MSRLARWWRRNPEISTPLLVAGIVAGIGVLIAVLVIGVLPNIGVPDQ